MRRAGRRARRRPRLAAAAPEAPTVARLTRGFSKRALKKSPVARAARARVPPQVRQGRPVKVLKGQGKGMGSLSGKPTRILAAAVQRIPNAPNTSGKGMSCESRTTEVRRIRRRPYDR